MTTKIGYVPSTLLDWVKQTEIDGGQRAATSTSDAQRIKESEREVKELRRANDRRRVLQMAPSCCVSSGHLSLDIDTRVRHMNRRQSASFQSRIWIIRPFPWTFVQTGST